MKVKFFAVFALLLTLLSFSFPHKVFADVIGCLKADSNGKCIQVQTAIGTINTNIGDLVNSVLGIILSIAGGVAVLLIIAAGYQMMTSQGNPEKVKEARERLTSAIVGLLFMIFAVTILQIIGVNILHIPGFK